MRGLVNRLRGLVRVRVECAFPERVLNLCGEWELAFWDLQWESPTAFTCSLSRKDCRALRQAAERLDCALTVVHTAGAPFFLGRLRRRAALAVGAVVCALALFLGSFFIWDFEITGNTTVPEETILRALERSGVKLGAFGLALDGEDIRNHILLDVPELSWIAVNVSGCRARVQVRERIFPPKLLDERTPANVVARRAGLVLEVRALDGVAAVLPGTSVTEGQLLISGVQDTGTFGSRLLAGMGAVEARTWYSLTCTVPLTAAEKRYTGREESRFALVVGTQRIKFFANSSIDGEKYDKITQRRSLSFLGVPLPVTWVRERLRFYETQAAALPRAAAERRAEAALTEYLKTQVEPHGEVVSTLVSAREKGGVLQVTLAAECREEIGKTVPILTEDAGGDP